MEKIGAIDHDYYQNYINRKKFEQLENTVYKGLHRVGI